MRNKNEKKKEATRLYNEVIKVSMTEFTTKSNNRKVLLCAINGERYIPLYTVSDMSYFFRRLLEKEEIPASDFIHVFHKTRVITLIKTSNFVKYYDDLLKQLKSLWEDDFLKEIYQLLSDEKLSVCDNQISKEAINKSEEAYVKRNKLIQEIARERRAEKMESESTPEQETIKQLVEKIEAMGWEVTLRLKPLNNNLRTQ